MKQGTKPKPTVKQGTMDIRRTHKMLFDQKKRKRRKKNTVKQGTKYHLNLYVADQISFKCISSKQEKKMNLTSTDTTTLPKSTYSIDF